MLTGDKVETAKCIAISTGIRSNTQDIFEMKEDLDEEDDDEDEEKNYQLILRDKL